MLVASGSAGYAVAVGLEELQQAHAARLRSEASAKRRIDIMAKLDANPQSLYTFAENHETVMTGTYNYE